jgi:hypothetical protein
MPIDSGYSDPLGRPSPQPASTTYSSRTPPPETTGAEVSYIVKQIEARTPMVFKLSGGELIRGVIEYYDRDLLKLTRQGAPSLLVRKENIDYMHKDEGKRSRRG